MKKSSHFHSGVVALALATAIAASAAQAPQPQQGAPAAPPEHEHNMPAPTNLKVLPKDLTAEQVHEIMHKWAGALGTGCSTCHAADPTRVGPNGRPRLNFADDSKPEKKTARLMFKMTEDINANYVSMVENSGQPVTCGTCHRGHVTPEPFIPPAEHEHHDGPPPAAPQPK